MPIHDWTKVLAGVFHDFHQTWIIEIKRALNDGLLPKPFYAMAEQIAGDYGPDVLALEAPQGPKISEAEAAPGSIPSGGVAVAVRAPVTRHHDTAEKDIYATKASAISIRHISNHRIVAVLEIVSPGNKNGRAAVRKFVEKAEEFLEGRIHFTMIDLFPPGKFDPKGMHNALWEQWDATRPYIYPPDRPLTLASYIAHRSPEVFLEPTAVGIPLIEMPLFVEEDWYVPLPLEATYQTAFDAVPAVWREALTGNG